MLFTRVLYMYYICVSVKSRFVRTTKSKLQLQNMIYNPAQNFFHIYLYIHMYGNQLFLTTPFQQRQYADAVDCRTFISGLISILSVKYCNFLVSASRFVVGTLHLLAPPGYWPDFRLLNTNTATSHLTLTNIYTVFHTNCFISLAVSKRKRY